MNGVRDDAVDEPTINNGVLLEQGGETSTLLSSPPILTESSMRMRFQLEKEKRALQSCIQYFRNVEAKHLESVCQFYKTLMTTLNATNTSEENIRVIKEEIEKTLEKAEMLIVMSGEMNNLKALIKNVTTDEKLQCIKEKVIHIVQMFMSNAHMWTQQLTNIKMTLHHVNFNSEIKKNLETLLNKTKNDINEFEKIMSWSNCLISISVILLDFLNQKSVETNIYVDGIFKKEILKKKISEAQVIATYAEHLQKKGTLSISKDMVENVTNEEEKLTLPLQHILADSQIQEECQIESMIYNLNFIFFIAQNLLLFAKEKTKTFLCVRKNFKEKISGLLENAEMAHIQQMKFEEKVSALHQNVITQLEIIESAKKVPTRQKLLAAAQVTSKTENLLLELEILNNENQKMELLLLLFSNTMYILNEVRKNLDNESKNTSLEEAMAKVMKQLPNMLEVLKMHTKDLSKKATVLSVNNKFFKNIEGEKQVLTELFIPLLDINNSIKEIKEKLFIKKETLGTSVVNFDLLLERFLFNCLYIINKIFVKTEMLNRLQLEFNFKAQTKKISKQLTVINAYAKRICKTYKKNLGHLQKKIQFIVKTIQPANWAQDLLTKMLTNLIKYIRDIFQFLQNAERLMKISNYVITDTSFNDYKNKLIDTLKKMVDSCSYVKFYICKMYSAMKSVFKNQKLLNGLKQLNAEANHIIDNSNKKILLFQEEMQLSCVFFEKINDMYPSGFEEKKKKREKNLDSLFNMIKLMFCRVEALTDNSTEEQELMISTSEDTHFAKEESTNFDKSIVQVLIKECNIRKEEIIKDFMKDIKEVLEELEDIMDDYSRVRNYILDISSSQLIIESSLSIKREFFLCGKAHLEKRVQAGKRLLSNIKESKSMILKLKTIKHTLQEIFNAFIQAEEIILKTCVMEEFLDINETVKIILSDFTHLSKEQTISCLNKRFQYLKNIISTYKQTVKILRQRLKFKLERKKGDTSEDTKFKERKEIYLKYENIESVRQLIKKINSVLITIKKKIYSLKNEVDPLQIKINLNHCIVGLVTLSSKYGYIGETICKLWNLLMGQHKKRKTWPQKKVPEIQKKNFDEKNKKLACKKRRLAKEVSRNKGCMKTREIGKSLTVHKFAYKKNYASNTKKERKFKSTEEEKEEEEEEEEEEESGEKENEGKVDSLHKDEFKNNSLSPQQSTESKNKEKIKQNKLNFLGININSSSIDLNGHSVRNLCSHINNNNLCNPEKKKSVRKTELQRTESNLAQFSSPVKSYLAHTTDTAIKAENSQKSVITNSANKEQQTTVVKRQSTIKQCTSTEAEQTSGSENGETYKSRHHRNLSEVRKPLYKQEPKLKKNFNSIYQINISNSNVLLNIYQIPMHSFYIVKNLEIENYREQIKISKAKNVCNNFFLNVCLLVVFSYFLRKILECVIKKA